MTGLRWSGGGSAGDGTVDRVARVVDEHGARRQDREQEDPEKGGEGRGAAGPEKGELLVDGDSRMVETIQPSAQRTGIATAQAQRCRARRGIARA